MVFLEGSRNRLGSPDWTAALYKKTARQELLHSLATFAMPDKLPKRTGMDGAADALLCTLLVHGRLGPKAPEGTQHRSPRESDKS